MTVLSIANLPAQKAFYIIIGRNLANTFSRGLVVETDFRSLGMLALTARYIILEVPFLLWNVVGKALSRLSWMAAPLWIGALSMGTGAAALRAGVIVETASCDLWNATRITFAVALLRGIQPYPSLDEGALLPCIYPPLGMFTHIPAALFADVQSIMVAGGLLSMCYAFAPVGFVLFTQVREFSGTLIAWAGLLAFAFYSQWSRALYYSLYEIHVDAPALGAAATACALVTRQLKRGNPSMLWPALFLAMAVSTKQTTFPLVLALPIYLWLAHGRWSAVRLFTTTLLWGLAFFVVLGAICGFRNMFVTAMWAPAQHPVQWDLWNLTLLVDEYIVPGLVPLLLAVISTPVWSRMRGRFSMHGPAPIFVFAGLALLPTAISGRIKVGGDVNNNSFVLYFLGIGGAIGLATLASWLITTVNRRRAGLALVGSAIAACLIVLGAQAARDNALGLEYALQKIQRSPVVDAYQIALSRPGEVYFPWYPFPVLLAEGRLYHHEFAVYELEMVGVRFSQERYLKNMPAKLKEVWLRNDEKFDFVRVPGFSNPGMNGDRADGWEIEFKRVGAWKVFTAGQPSR